MPISGSRDSALLIIYGGTRWVYVELANDELLKSPLSGGGSRTYAYSNFYYLYVLNNMYFL